MALFALVPCVSLAAAGVAFAWVDSRPEWAWRALSVALFGALATAAAAAVATVVSSVAVLGPAAWRAAAAAVAARRPPRAGVALADAGATPAPSALELLFGVGLLYTAAVVSVAASFVGSMVDMATTSGAPWQWCVTGSVTVASLVVIQVCTAATGAADILYWGWAAAGAASRWWRATAARGVWPPAAAACAVAAAWRRVFLAPPESAEEMPMCATVGSLLAGWGVFSGVIFSHIALDEEEAADRRVVLVIVAPALLSSTLLGGVGLAMGGLGGVFWGRPRPGGGGGAPLPVSFYEAVAAAPG